MECTRLCELRKIVPRSRARTKSNSNEAAPLTNPLALLPLPPRPLSPKLAATRLKKLPHLTLFTGGSECTLCTVAKEDLADVQRVQPFHLSLYNIRRQPDDTPTQFYERQTWRRLYQYEIPALHLGQPADFDNLAGRGNLKGGRIMRHRIDKEKLVAHLKEWTAQLNSGGSSD